MSKDHIDNLLIDYLVESVMEEDQADKELSVLLDKRAKRIALEEEMRRQEEERRRQEEEIRKQQEQKLKKIKKIVSWFFIIILSLFSLFYVIYLADFGRGYIGAFLLYPTHLETYIECQKEKEGQWWYYKKKYSCSKKITYWGKFPFIGKYSKTVTQKNYFFDEFSVSDKDIKDTLLIPVLERLIKSKKDYIKMTINKTSFAHINFPFYQTVERAKFLFKEAINFIYEINIKILENIKPFYEKISVKIIEKVKPLYKENIIFLNENIFQPFYAKILKPFYEETIKPLYEKIIEIEFIKKINIGE